MRSNRIKEENISQAFTIASAGAVQYTNALCGEILEIKAQSNRAGSVSIYESGNTTNAFYSSDTISGTNPTYAAPRDLTEAATGSAAAYGVPTPFIINGPLAINIGSVASGTTTNFNVRIRFR